MFAFTLGPSVRGKRLRDGESPQKTRSFDAKTAQNQKMGSAPGRVALALVLLAGFADAFAPATLPFASSYTRFSTSSLKNRVPVLRPSLRGSTSKVLQVYSQLPGVKSSANSQEQPRVPDFQGLLGSARKFVNAGALCVLLGLGLLTGFPETSTAQLPGLELPAPEAKV